MNPGQPQNPQYPPNYPPPYQPPPRKKSNAWWIILLCLAPFAFCIVGLFVAGVGSVTSSSSSTPQTTGAPAAVTPAFAPTSIAATLACETPSSGVVGFLDAALGNEGYSLSNARQVTRAANGDLYIGGDIMRGDTRVSSSDVWLVRAGVTYALSSDARKLSGIGDGRDLPGPKPATLLGPSAGDEWGSAVQECVTSARRGR